MIYLDNAATTFPKPESVLSSMVEVYRDIGVSPGRGSYDLATEAEEYVARARNRLARFFEAPDPDRVIFTSNATDALNLAIQGMVKAGDHVVSTRLEHNSVLRPLYHLKLKGIIDYDLVPFGRDGFVDPDDIGRAIKPNTGLVVVSHASNVLGTVQPIAEIARQCSKAGVRLLVDAAQTAGVIPIRMESWGVAAVAFTGHKSMLGPSGIGGLVLNREVNVEPIRFGGTGVDSWSPLHTETFPHRLECGTLNLLGIIGLFEAIEYLERSDICEIHKREMGLLTRLRDGLSNIDGITLYRAEDLVRHVGLLIANVRGFHPEKAGAILDGDFDIAVRVGLHCAPLVHEDIGTFPEGAIRFSLGPFNTGKDIDVAVEAMGAIARAAGYADGQ
ncbi:MAG TPA: aminotransferase class V-fold PLP-dependent enzyme [Syntrophorhabdales bacterium]|nr:aminotransferase class V-fold PLP-dependent enzyme [Syntrophorhabdales bacterium]